MWITENTDYSENVASTFLLSAWHELFEGFTPDSFQPRLHNVPSLVEELVDLSRLWKGEVRMAPHIEKVQSELNLMVRSADDILCRIPEYRTRVNRLFEASSADTIIAGGEILIEKRNLYWNAFEANSGDAIANLPRGKKAAMSAIRGLATFAFQQGKEDDDLWDPMPKDAARSPDSIFRDMINLTQKGDQEFLCTLSIIGSIDEMHSLVRKKGHEVMSHDSLPKHYRDELTAPRHQTLHVRMSVTERSIRHAVAKARKQLEGMIGFVSMYTNPASLRLHSKALVSHQNEDRIFVQTEQAFRRLFPRSNARRDIKEVIELTSTHPLDRRILAAIEQLAIASGSADTRTRLVSLWASIETLAGAHEGKTILERVCELLTPLVISRHVHRTTRYLTILIQRFSQQTGKANFGSGFNPNNRNLASQEDMLVTLTSECNGRKMLDLLGFADHPLLRFRLYETWETLHDPRKLSSRLKASKQRLEWQIARIYRARNRLVHDGEEVRFTVPLLDNLQNYLSMLVQRIIHELKRHPNWSLRHLIEYWNGRMSHAIDCLDKCPSAINCRDFLERGDATPLWTGYV